MIYHYEPISIHPVPSFVKEAIANYSQDTVLQSPSTRETSVIYCWGVRVGNETAPDRSLKRVCLAVQTCREQRVSFTLSGGKTSKAAKHLRDTHGVESAQTLAQVRRKRSHGEEMKRLQ
ncbi:hypothetical protein PF010_g11433 [Phytophthora fragariae]|uniref:Uncharacterized protein n=1 Tax=Phytophthora fragariae TaxID=53985 RepID=A0A6G0L5N5_9STRA|nr:hypothetical protein PF010_g11433 [Phytophthora fragariae]